jgi:hypothetical protein
MNWKDFWRRLRDVLGDLFGGGPSPKPPDEPDEPVEPPAPGREQKVYDVELEVGKARGVLAAKYEGARVKAVLVVEGTTDDFDEPIGNTFVVSGEVKKVTGTDDSDLTGDLQGNTKMKPQDYIFKSHEIRYERDDDRMKVSGRGKVALNWETIEGIYAEGEGKGINAIAVEKAVVAGYAVLR